MSFRFSLLAAESGNNNFIVSCTVTSGICHLTKSFWIRTAWLNPNCRKSFCSMYPWYPATVFFCLKSRTFLCGTRFSRYSIVCSISAKFQRWEQMKKQVKKTTGTADGLPLFPSKTNRMPDGPIIGCRQNGGYLWKNYPATYWNTGIAMYLPFSVW